MKRQFTATLTRSPNSGGWTYVVMPGSAEFFGTRGLVKVRGTVDGHAQPQTTRRPGAGGGGSPSTSC